jgi:hypothetical protein
VPSAKISLRAPNRTPHPSRCALPAARCLHLISRGRCAAVAPFYSRCGGVRPEPACGCALAAAYWLSICCGRCASEVLPSLGFAAFVAVSASWGWYKKGGPKSIKPGAPKCSPNKHRLTLCAHPEGNTRLPSRVLKGGGMLACGSSSPLVLVQDGCVVSSCTAE